SITTTTASRNNNGRKFLPLSSSYPPPNSILTLAAPISTHLDDKKTFIANIETSKATTSPHHRLKAHPKIIWRDVDAVCFDVDSTVCRDEAIDELAEFCGCGERVAEMTRVAMNGNMTFRQALTTRLNIIRPSVNDVNNFLHANPPRLTEGIADLIESLHDRRIPVYLVTGGF
uniref:Phosphoserine phosphatase n=1 Tax=Romanomermis culicivorax TaxID=13658 RepID=A0A915INE8_ROMCU